jgi:hypothetical protein
MNLRRTSSFHSSTPNLRPSGCTLSLMMVSIACRSAFWPALRRALYSATVTVSGVSSAAAVRQLDNTNRSAWAARSSRRMKVRWLT